jgi:hypothetical protein
MHRRDGLAASEVVILEIGGLPSGPFSLSFYILLKDCSCCPEPLDRDAGSLADI